MREFLSDDEIRSHGTDIEEARKKLFMEEYLPEIRAFPKTRALFERIVEDGHRIVLASSASGDELAAYKEKAGIADLVEDETSKDEVEQSKPHPDIFEAAVDRLDGLDRSEILIVGDSPWDGIAAGRAGVKIIGVRCGGFSDQDLLQAGCLMLLDDPADFLRRYGSLPWNE